MPIQQHLYSFFLYYVSNSISCSMFFYVSLNFPHGNRRTTPPQCHPRRKSPANLSTGHVAGLGHHRHHGTQKHLVAVCWAWWDLTTLGKIKTKHIYIYVYIIHVYDMIWCIYFLFSFCFQYEPWNKHSHSHGHKCFPRWSWASVWGTESLSISCHKMRAPGNFNRRGEHDGAYLKRNIYTSPIYIYI